MRHQPYKDLHVDDSNDNDDCDERATTHKSIHMKIGASHILKETKDVHTQRRFMIEPKIERGTFLA